MTAPKKPRASNSDVMGNLPSSRPHRRSPKRAAAPSAKPTRRPKARLSATSRPIPGAIPKRRPLSDRAAAASKPLDRTDPPRGTELVGTAIQAAGELAQIGLSAGIRALRSATSQLPKR